MGLGEDDDVDGPEGPGVVKREYIVGLDDDLHGCPPTLKASSQWKSELITPLSQRSGQVARHQAVPNRREVGGAGYTTPASWYAHLPGDDVVVVRLVPARRFVCDRVAVGTGWRVEGGER